MSDLSLLNHFSPQTYELGGVAANIKKTTKKLSTLILGEFRVRKAISEEMDDIFRMGFDTWGAETTKEKYLQDCRGSAKYANGQWWVLEDGDGRAVSSMIAYDLNFETEIKMKVKGFGSIATIPEMRKKGHASLMIHDLIDKFWHHEGVRAFYLYADINPKFYEKLNFVRLPEHLQRHEPSTAMLRCHQEVRDKIFKDPKYQPPNYF